VMGCGNSNLESTENSTQPTPQESTRMDQTQATYSQVNQQILQPHCVSCHNPNEQFPDLRSYAAFATNTEYVVPGKPDQSLIYEITKSGAMPLGGPHLTQAQLSLLSSWIQAGAKNN